jgi:RimJ/RimL family protein N-acetyltransferase
MHRRWLMATATDLVTKRLTLEPLKLADTQAIYEIAREKESIEDFQYVAHSLDDVKAWLEPSYHDPTNRVWVIRRQGRAIGLFGACLEAEYSELTNDTTGGRFRKFTGYDGGRP